MILKLQMTRLSEGTVVIGKEIELTEDEVLRLEIKMIELGRLLETDRLDYDNVGNLVVRYKSMVEFMDQQTHSDTQPTSNSSSVLALFIVQLKKALLDSLVESHTMNTVAKETI